jgi:hypothetical protein
MAWNKDKPAGGDKIRLSDDYIRANNEALENAFSEGHEFSTGGNQTGKHVTPTWKDSGGAPASDPSSNERIIYNNAGAMLIRDNGGVDHHLGGVPSGTKMLFKQGSAPTGWTFASEDNDKVLLNTSTEADGGSTGGSWTISGWSFSVDNHTLTISEIPSHNHAMYVDINDNQGASEVYRPDAFKDGNDTVNTGNTGGGDPHSHGFTSSHDGSWRPSYAKVITCEKA